jgi:hypothetical protein
VVAELRQLSEEEFAEIERVLKSCRPMLAGHGWLHEHTGNQLIFTSPRAQYVLNAYHTLGRAGYRVRMDRIVWPDRACVVFEEIDGEHVCMRLAPSHLEQFVELQSGFRLSPDSNDG